MNDRRAAAEPLLIVGAGPAGLAAAAVHLRAGIACRILERGTEVGGAYAVADPEMRLLTPRSMTDLPYAPLAGDPALRVAVGEYREYLQAYCRDQHIPVEYGMAVTRVEKTSQGYAVHDSRGGRHECRKVIVATGSYGQPKPWPLDPARYPRARLLQAGDWRELRASAGKSVLIVGSGVSAAELATELAGSCRVWLAMRDGLRTWPATFLGIAIQYWMRPLEWLPRAFLARYCSGQAREPLIDVGLSREIARGRVRLCAPGTEPSDVEVVVNATGYRHDTTILPPDALRDRHGRIRTRNNEVISHPGLFLIGFPCSAAFDSKFIRGIRRDAFRILRATRKDLSS